MPYFSGIPFYRRFPYFSVSLKRHRLGFASSAEKKVEDGCFRRLRFRLTNRAVLITVAAETGMREIREPGTAISLATEFPAPKGLIAKYISLVLLFTDR